MVIFITGSSHTGKTVLAQKLLQKYHYPYLSIDHLKMGLIRSGYCGLSPESGDGALTDYLWPVVREMARTALENRQNLTIEGCYIPFDYARGFEESKLDEIRAVCIIFSDRYIRNHYEDIMTHASDIELREEEGYCTPEMLMNENRKNLDACRLHDFPYILVDDSYQVDVEL